MTTKQRKQYLTLHAVRELVRGMAEQRNLHPRVEMLLAQIDIKATRMIESMPITFSDARAFSRAAERLTQSWDGDDSRHTPEAFISIALTLVADQVAAIPAKAVSVRNEFSDLEGLLADLYGHFDPEFDDRQASMEGEAVANEYRCLVAV